MALSAAGNAVPSWQWLDDARQWTNYGSTPSADFEARFLAGVATFRHMTLAGERYKIYFEEMHQVNVVSGFRRPIRRHKAGPCSELWEISAHGSWHALPRWVCHQLEACRTCGRPSTVAHVRGQVSTYDLANSRGTVHRKAFSFALRSRHARATANIQPPSAAMTTVRLRHRPSSTSALARTPGRVLAASRRATTASDVSGVTSVLNRAKDCTSDVDANATCCLCLSGFEQAAPALLLPECRGHYVHRDCIIEIFKRMGPKCPTCGHVYGGMFGSQPPGTMTVKRFAVGKLSLSGHESVGTIAIYYKFQDGIQGYGHPSPGQGYSGTSRVSYLPDIAEGQYILGLLRRCFDRKLTFTIGTSLTTGQPNQIVWNGVHHKTSRRGGSTRHGYPDSNYFRRVRAELAAKGID